jgi:hypothetical protein
MTISVRFGFEFLSHGLKNTVISEDVELARVLLFSGPQRYEHLGCRKDP